MVIFHCYVSSPEGTSWFSDVFGCSKGWYTTLVHNTTHGGRTPMWQPAQEVPAMLIRPVIWYERLLLIPHPLLYGCFMRLLTLMSVLLEGNTLFDPSSFVQSKDVADQLCEGRKFAQDDAINELQNINGSTKQLSSEMWRLPISMHSSFSVATIPPQGSTRAFPSSFERLIINPFPRIWNTQCKSPGLILDASTYRVPSVPSVPSVGSIQHTQKMGVASVIEPVNLRHATDSMKKPKVAETQSPGDQNLQEYNAWAVPKFEGTKKTNAEVVSSWEIKQLYANPQVTWYILISLIDKLTRVQQKSGVVLNVQW